jgi:hypothetical protein
MDTRRLYLLSRFTDDKKTLWEHKSLLSNLVPWLNRIFVSAGQVDNQTEGKSTHSADDISNMVRGGISGHHALCHQCERNGLACGGSGYSVYLGNLNGGGRGVGAIGSLV